MARVLRRLLALLDRRQVPAAHTVVLRAVPGRRGGFVIVRCPIGGAPSAYPNAQPASPGIGSCRGA